MLTCAKQNDIAPYGVRAGAKRLGRDKKIAEKRKNVTRPRETTVLVPDDVRGVQAGGCANAPSARAHSELRATVHWLVEEAHHDAEGAAVDGRR
ncbi:MAG: hypothetical protein BJ554DRAFT_1141 [Olpidium bornovanus]|uniref:Uncharacterized protein n=1 Tax=Olpidium bornovanus TaxID=278681 RepID=A0A8H8DLV9_9FUNG|nr:MAG: hypothetical protein BJ554DRAFT_1141 [Olpidium bornovanus]